MPLVLIDLEWAPDPEPDPSVWSIDLCQGWQRIGQLQGDAYTFDGVERFRALGEWNLEFPDDEPAWASRKVPDLPNYLLLTGNTMAYADDTAALDVTGDIDVRWFGTLTDWNGTSQVLVSKWDAFTNNRSWLLWATPSGIQVVISTAGTAGTEAGSAGFPVSAGDDEYVGIRFTRVQATGVTTVYFSDDDGITWASAGTSTLAAGTAIFSSNADVIAGGHTGGLGSPATGRYVWIEYRNGINGTVVASPDFSDGVPRQHLFFNPLADPQGNLWRGLGNARIFQDPLVDIVEYTPRDVDTIRLVENNELRYAGFVAEPDQNGTGGVERTYDADGIRWTMNGPDLWDILNTRIAWTDPTAAFLTGTAATARDINTGIGSTVLATYLSDNAGVTALTDRQIAGFSVVDNIVGTGGTWSARLEPLTALARRVLEDADITIRWTVTFNGDVIASIETPRDLSASHVLSDQGDLVSVTSKLVPARSTWLAAAGNGEGITRLFRTADSTGVTGLNRRERLVDVSSLTEASEVQATANTHERLDAATWVVSGEVVDTVTRTIGFGRSVFVGDKVSIQSAGQRFAVPVSSIAWHIEAGRQVVRPALGEAVPDALKGLLQTLADLSERTETNVA